MDLVGLLTNQEVISSVPYNLDQAPGSWYKLGMCGKSYHSKEELIEASAVTSLTPRSHFGKIVSQEQNHIWEKMTEISATFENLKDAHMEATSYLLLICQCSPCKNETEAGEWL